MRLLLVNPDLWSSGHTHDAMAPLAFAALAGNTPKRHAIRFVDERVETVDWSRFDRSNVDAAALAKMAEQGWVKGGVVDGPLGLEVAISPRAAELEESDSPIAGLADILIVPNVEAGNIVAKGLLYFARARMAGLVVGAKVPIVISSRADSAETRYLSLAMAAILARSS